MVDREVCFAILLFLILYKVHDKIPLPVVPRSYFFTAMANTVGWRQAERALQQGALYSGPEALQAGLVDELLPQDELMATAHRRMDEWLTIPGNAVCSVLHN